jgi:hypothetical protein
MAAGSPSRTLLVVLAVARADDFPARCGRSSMPRRTGSGLPAARRGRVADGPALGQTSTLTIPSTTRTGKVRTGR